MRKIRILIAFSLGMALNANGQCPTDKGFEIDSFDNWYWNITGYDTLFNEKYNSSPNSNNPITPTGFKHSEVDASGKARWNWEIIRDYTPYRVDKYGGYYLVDTSVHGVFKLGGDSTRSREGLLKEKYAVSSTDTVMNFKFALVMEDPGHEHDSSFTDSIHAIQNPFFGVRIKYSTQPDSEYQFVPIITPTEIPKTYPIVSDTSKFWIPTYYSRFNPINGEMEPSKVNILPWQCGYINLKPYQGFDIDIEFVVSDCRDKGHFGYAYIDDVCDCEYKPICHFKYNCEAYTVEGTAIPFKKFGPFKELEARLIRDGVLIDSLSILSYWSGSTDKFSFPISVFNSHFMNWDCDSLMDLDSFSIQLYARDSMGHTYTEPLRIDLRNYFYNTFFNATDLTVIDHVLLDTIIFKFDISDHPLACMERCYVPLCKFRNLTNGFNFDRGFASIPDSIMHYKLIKSDSIVDCHRGIKEYSLQYRCRNEEPCVIEWDSLIIKSIKVVNPNAGQVIDSTYTPYTCDTFQADTIYVEAKPGFYTPILDEGGDTIGEKWNEPTFPDTVYRPYRIECSGGTWYREYEPDFIYTNVLVPNPVSKPDSNLVCDPRFVNISFSVHSNRLKCDNFVCVTNANTMVNPFLTNLRGQIKPFKSFVYHTKRDVIANNMRRGEYYRDFNPLYAKGTWAKSSDPNWIAQNTMTNYNLQGAALEMKNPLDIYSSNRFLSLNNSIQTTLAVNARYKEAVALSFEDIDFNKNQNELNWLLSKMSVFDNIKEIRSSKDEHHTGHTSLLIRPTNPSSTGFITAFVFLCGPDNPNENNPVYTLSDSSVRTVENSYSADFQLEQDKKYIISYWVRDDSLSFGTLNNQGYISVNIDCDSIFHPSPIPGNNIEGWQRKQEEFYVPSNAKNVAFSFIPAGTGTYYDDIRVYPADGSMVSYVFDFKQKKMTAQMDENNYATFYDYDEEGQLIRMRKETERGIMTISEGRKTMIQK